MSEDSTPGVGEGAYVRVFEVDELLLDPLNPRVETAGDADQRAILNAIVAEGVEQILRLAADIADAGTLNPADLPMVVLEDVGPVVVEGNRRLAALRLLADPSQLDDAELVKRAAKLGDGANIGAITCTVFGDREAADRWIRLRHTGENEGVGIRSWGAAAQARFEERSQGRVAVHTAFLGWIESTYPGNETLQGHVVAIRKGQLTTLKRLLFGSVRPLLVLDWHAQKLTVTANQEAMETFLERWFAELVTGRVSDSTARLWSRFTENDMLEYVRAAGAGLDVAEPELDGLEWSAPDDELTPIAPPVPNPTPAAGGASAPPRPGQPPLGPAPVVPAARQSKRSKLFVGVPFKAFGNDIAQLADQANQLAIDHQPRVAGVMLRVILDLCLQEFFRRHNRTVTSKDVLWRLVRDAIGIVDSTAANGDGPLAATYRAFDKGRGGLAADTMHGWVHALAAPETAPSEVRSMADCIEPLLVATAQNLRQT